MNYNHDHRGFEATHAVKFRNPQGRYVYLYAAGRDQAESYRWLFGGKVIRLRRIALLKPVRAYNRYESYISYRRVAWIGVHGELED